jgi:LmbE family N-acetylglucosaminyl deacetylase
MGTLVSFHAHPDDETISTGGTLAKAADAGHRVVVVFATRGEHGEVADGFLAPGESLGERRVKESLSAAEILGTARVEFLGYVDSGMMGTPENDAPESFWQANVEEAASRLADIISEERPDVLTVYDEHGGYGHPDHIQVHRVGVRAGELAGVGRVYEAVANRDNIKRGFDAARAAGVELPDDVGNLDLNTFGTPEEDITTAVDVSAYLERKREAMAAHASQISDTSFFLAMPPDMFAMAFGTEWFVLRGTPGGIREHDLL